MKYPVEYKPVKNVDDLLKRIAEEEENYQKEKAEIEAEGLHADPNLYMQYHAFSCNVIARMTRHLDNKRANVLRPYLGEGHEENQKNTKAKVKLFNFNADSILTAIEKGKAAELLAAIKKIKTLDINETIRDEVTFILRREEKEFDADADKRERDQLIEEKSHVKHTGGLVFNQKKSQHAVNEVNTGKYEQNEQRQQDIVNKAPEKAAKTFVATRSSGRGYRIYNNESVNGRQRRQLKNVKDATSYTEIPDVHFTNTSFDAVREAIDTFSVRVNNVIEDRHLYEACGLNVMKELYAIRKNRGFFQKLFHPFRNSDEKEAIENFRMELVRNNVDVDKIAATKNSDVDYIEEYRENYLEADDFEEYKQSLVIDENEEAEDVKENNNVAEDKKEVIEEEVNELDK